MLWNECGEKKGEKNEWGDTLRVVPLPENQLFLFDAAQRPLGQEGLNG